MKLLTQKQIYDDIVETPLTLDTLVFPPFIGSKDNHVRVMQKLQIEAMSNPSNLLIAKIKKLCRKHPDVPVLKNLLMQVLVSLGYSKKAQTVLDESIIQHPDYLTSKLNKSAFYYAQDQTELMLETIDGKLTLREHLPTQTVFHWTDLVNFYKVVGLYYSLLQDIERLSSVIEALTTIKGVKNDDIGILRDSLRALS